eukprot:g25644.t1
MFIDQGKGAQKAGTEGRVYIITKGDNRNGDPQWRGGDLFYVDLPEQSGWHNWQATNVRLSVVLATGADMTPRGSLIAVRTGRRVAVSREAPRQEALSKGPCGVKSKNERQGEAIAFGKDGKHYITVSEGKYPSVWFFGMTQRFQDRMMHMAMEEAQNMAEAENLKDVNNLRGDIYQAIRMEQVYPLDVAEALGNDKMVRLLVEAGAKKRASGDSMRLLQVLRPLGTLLNLPTVALRRSGRRSALKRSCLAKSSSWSSQERRPVVCLARPVTSAGREKTEKATFILSWEVIYAVGLGYLVGTTYWSGFRWRVAGWYGLYSNRNTDAGSLLWCATLLSRLVMPLSYHFLLLIRVPLPTSFQVAFNRMDSGTLLPTNKVFVPILLCLVLCHCLNVYSKLLQMLSLENLDFDTVETGPPRDQRPSHEVLSEGRRLVEIARRRRSEDRTLQLELNERAEESGRAIPLRMQIARLIEEGTLPQDDE